MKKDDLNTIEITLEDIEIIMGDRFSIFPKILDSCFCVNCESQKTSILNYQAYLNNLQDIILEGQCGKCGQPVGRYIETGENKESVETAKHIRHIKKGKFR